MKLTKTDSVPAEIVDRLYLGSIGVAFNKESLIEHGITHIMTCADNLRPKYPDVSFVSLNWLLGLLISSSPLIRFPWSRYHEFLRTGHSFHYWLTCF